MRQPVESLRALCAAAPLALLSFACGTVSVKVPVMRPAEINMGPYTSVGVGEMHHSGSGTSGGDRALSDGLEEVLVNSQRFQVVDRQHMASTMRELQLSASDLADPKKAARLGRLVTAGALIYGDVVDNYREQPSEEQFKDKDGKPHTTRKLRGEASVRATFKVVDVATGRLLISKTYEEKRDDTNRGYDERPAPIDKDGLFKSARQSVLDRFLKAIMPHQEFVYANFRKDSDIPQLEGGIGWAERGSWDKAKEAFTSAIGDCEKNPKIKSPQLAKAYFNLGLAYEYSADYDNARKMVEKAYQLSNDNDFLTETDNIKRLQDDARKLAEQTAQPEAAGGR